MSVSPILYVIHVLYSAHVLCIKTRIAVSGFMCFCKLHQTLSYWEHFNMVDIPKLSCQMTPGAGQIASISLSALILGLGQCTLGIASVAQGLYDWSPVLFLNYTTTSSTQGRWHSRSRWFSLVSRLAWLHMLS